MTDFLVIGSGSAGAHTAYFLKKAGYKVVVADRLGIAQGASRAAGAFVSPRLGRGGILQRVTNEAFRFAIRFYKQNFPHLFFQTGILRIPKDEADAEKFEGYKEFIDVEHKVLTPNEIDFLKPYATEEGAILFPTGGVVEAASLCEALLEGVEFREVEIDKIEKNGEGFICGDIEAKNVIIASGAWDELLPTYMNLSKVAGFRFDVKSSLSLPYSVHKKISISKPINGRIIIGATHSRVDKAASFVKPNTQLLEEAKKMVDSEFEIDGFLCGVRPSVNDHLPYIGKVADVERSFKQGFKRRPSLEDIEHTPGLYMIGGFGGRGFVFGPLMAKKLVDLILYDKIDKDVDSDRFFLRWAKRGGNV